jgi:hypothetical protein
MRRSNRHAKQTKNSRWPLVIGSFIFLAFSFLAFVYYKVATLDKFIYVDRTEVGDAEIIIVDSDEGSVLKYLVPADTELSSSQGYGNYKLSSLWILSEKDTSEGKIVSDTLMKNYNIPIYNWKDGSKSNLNFFQRIKAFLIGLQNLSVSEVFDNNNLSNSILINFLDSDISDNQLKIEIDDLTGSYSALDFVSKTVEVLGAKVSSNSKGYDKDLDCIVSGKNILYVAKIANIFSCSQEIDESTNSDLKIKLGAKFVQRI